MKLPALVKPFSGGWLVCFLIFFFLKVQKIKLYSYLATIVYFIEENLF